MRRSTTLFLCVLPVFGFFALVSCEEQTGTHVNPPLSDTSGISSSGTMSLEGEIISVPSPTQLSMLIQRANIPFNESLLNPVSNQNQYLTEVSRALNLGVYGADLAYAANYNYGQTNQLYFEAIGKLSADLQIIDHIDQKLVTSLNNHIGNRDSLLRMNAQFFKAGDAYLKQSSNTDLAGLILFGGWVEALYISVKVAGDNPDIRARVGEQKHAAASLVRLIRKVNDPSLDGIKGKMEEVASIFDSLPVKYEYQKPINDSKEKITYLRSKTTIQLDEAQLTELAAAVEELRKLIIQ